MPMMEALEPLVPPLLLIGLAMAVLSYLRLIRRRQRSREERRLSPDLAVERWRSRIPRG